MVTWLKEITRKCVKYDFPVYSSLFLYGWLIKVSDLWCIKIGKTKRQIPIRAAEYIKEHQNQDFKEGTFFPCFAIKFENEETLKYAEKLVHSITKNYPLNVGQHSLVEQYDAVKVWKYIKKDIDYFPFSRAKFINNMIDDIIKNYKPVDDNKLISVNKPKQSIVTTNDLILTINNLTKKELVKIKGIGEKSAVRIIEKKPFVQIKDIIDIEGIGVIKCKNIIMHIKENIM